MKSALEELYFGGGGLYEKVVEGEEYDKLFSDYGEVYEKLFEGANEEQKVMLDKLFLLSGGLEAETALTHFKEGFKFCMRLMLESLMFEN